MKKRKKSKALVHVCSDRPMTPAERQRKRREIQGSGKMLVKGLVVDVDALELAVQDHFWIARGDSDDPEKVMAATSRMMNSLLETDAAGNFYRMPNAPEAESRVTAMEIEICYPRERNR